MATATVTALDDLTAAYPLLVDLCAALPVPVDLPTAPSVTAVQEAHDALEETPDLDTDQVTAVDACWYWLTARNLLTGPTRTTPQARRYLTAALDAITSAHQEIAGTEN